MSQRVMKVTLAMGGCLSDISFHVDTQLFMGGHIVGSSPSVCTETSGDSSSSSG